MAHINSVIAFSNTTTTITIGPGTAVGSGNGIVGFVNVYTGGVASLSLTVTGVAGSNTLTMPGGVVELGDASGNYYFNFYGIGLTGGPTTAVFTIGGLGAHTVTFGGGLWDEFSTELASGKALDVAATPKQYIGNTPTTANGTTSNTATTRNVSELIYSWGNGQGDGLSIGTTLAWIAGATDGTSANWGEYLTQTATSVQATWTSANLNSTAIIGLMAFGTPAAAACAHTLPMLGVGCSIGWRAALLGGAAWRAGKVIEENGIITRRGALGLSRRSLLIGHNGGPSLDD